MESRDYCPEERPESKWFWLGHPGNLSGAIPVMVLISILTPDLDLGRKEVWHSALTILLHDGYHRNVLAGEVHAVHLWLEISPQHLSTMKIESLSEASR